MAIHALSKKCSSPHARKTLSGVFEALAPRVAGTMCGQELTQQPAPRDHQLKPDGQWWYSRNKDHKLAGARVGRRVPTNEGETGRYVSQCSATTRSKTARMWAADSRGSRSTCGQVSTAEQRAQTPPAAAAAAAAEHTEL